MTGLDPTTGGGWTPYLDPDERIVWQGAPKKSGVFVLGPQDALLIPFSLVWGGFALFWNVGVWQTGAPVIFKLFGLPFLIVGLYIVIGRFFHAAARRKRTVYALSRKRAFIATSLFGRTLRTMPLTAQTEVQLNPARGGSITLGPTVSPFAMMRGWGGWSGQTNAFTFENLDAAESVYREIRKIQRGGA